MDAKPYPKEITRVNTQDIKILWRDGHESIFEPRYIRTNCQCAQCVDENTGKKILDETKVQADVKPLNISPVGRYAIHITWSDGHTSGIFTFEHLRNLCKCQRCLESKQK